MMTDKIKQTLKDAGLKITPQRLAILEAMEKLKNHPTADNIIAYIRNQHPNIATGTVYKILDTLVEKKIIERIKTDKDIMRYDSAMEHHHHIYVSGSNKIEDYTDPELDLLLAEYFRKKGIPGFEIEELRVQIIGKSQTKK